MKNKKLAWLKNNKWLTLPLLFFLNLLSRFPWSVLFAIAFVMAFLLHRVFRYRLSIVRKNLKNSFPEKSIKERKIIEHKFYHSFAQILMEVIKFRNMKPEELKQRARFTPSSIQLMDRFYREGKSVLIVMGHMGNWEMAG
jgi:KDO2-lipid IV(A) lauroyltransferase